MLEVPEVLDAVCSKPSDPSANMQRQRGYASRSCVRHLPHIEE